MATCDLTLGPDGRMKGTMSAPQGPMSTQGPMPVELKRTGEAKVELIPASPAVSKELEGDWEGSLHAPNGEVFPLVFHFKNQPDKTVAATMDSPGRNAMAMPLNDVKQTGQKVEFGIKIAGASFQGSLNKEGAELAGALIHDADSTPLTLRRKVALGAPPRPPSAAVGPSNPVGPLLFVTNVGARYDQVAIIDTGN